MLSMSQTGGEANALIDLTSTVQYLFIQRQ
jgi:hypothetical protein